METPNSKLPQDDFFQQVQQTEKALQEDIKKESDKTSKKQNTSDILSTLLKKGQIIDSFNVFGINWEMKLLNQDELLNVQRETIIRGLSESFSSRFSSNIIETLATAIVSIDGKSIASLFKDIEKANYDTDDGYKTALRGKLRLYLGKLAPDILNELFEKYTELNNKRSKEINELKKK